LKDAIVEKVLIKKFAKEKKTPFIMLKWCSWIFKGLAQKSRWGDSGGEKFFIDKNDFCHSFKTRLGVDLDQDVGHKSGGSTLVDQFFFKIKVTLFWPKRVNRFLTRVLSLVNPGFDWVKSTQSFHYLFLDSVRFKLRIGQVPCQPTESIYAL
jgi:hypothetical protein